MEQQSILDNDADPLFASQSAGAAAASWNPALRKNSEAEMEDEDDDFFNRYPGPTPKKETEVMDASTIEELAEPESPVRRSRASTQLRVGDAQTDMATNLESVSRDNAITERPISQVYYEEDDDEALLRDQEVPILSPDETREEQDEALEHEMPNDSMRDVEDGEQMSSEDDEQSSSDHYDHQGEVTEMEEAQEPSAEASLLRNEEPLPTSELLRRESTFATPSREPTTDFDDGNGSQPQSDTYRAPPPLDRSFTTNFSESPVEPTQRHIRSISQQWPSIGDDQTFGELLDNRFPPDSGFEAQVHGQRDALQSIAEKESEQVASPDLDLLPENEPEEKEADLDAGWAALDDDDDMLEETPRGFDPSGVFDDDDGGFLEDELLEEPVPTPIQNQSVQSQRTAPTTQYRPANLQPIPPQQQQQAGIPSPSMFDQNTHSRGIRTPSTGLHDVHNQYPSAYQQQPAQPQRPSVLQQSHAQSFSDKSKGGYQSPYDLPMEVVKPRRRPQNTGQPTPAQTPGPPPPRKSSLSSPVGGQQPFSQQLPPQPPSVSSLSPPNSRGSTGSSGGQPLTMKSPPRNAGASGFFEELPVTKPRARPAPAPTAQTMPSVPTLSSQMPHMSPQQQRQQQNMYQTASGPISPPRRQNNAYPQGQISPQRGVSQQQPGAFGGLRQPDRMPLLPDQPSSQPQAQQPAVQAPAANMRYSPQSNISAPAPPPSLPAVQNRYSPAPPAPTSQPPAASTRYSPAPASQPQQKPRQTSAPANALNSVTSNPFAPRTSSPLAAYTDKPQPALPSADSTGLQRAMAPPTSPPKVNGLRRSPPESINPPIYPPEKTRSIDPSQQFGPPLQRPQTQSPDNSMKVRQATRPGSVGITSAPSQPAARPKGPVLPHRRQSSRQLTFAAPQDERNMDPLQRWRGYPIFNWNASGTILSTFPKHTPFYAAGNMAPSLKCTPGSITVQDASQFMSMNDRNAKFPGPLAARSKGRKKDVLGWMTGKIEDLDKQNQAVQMDFSIPVDLKTRTEEKLVLWRIMRIFVENDGVLEGNPKIDEEVRRVLVPNLPQMAQVAELSSPGATVQRDAVDKSITLQLRQALLEGKRDQAVWLAEEKKLWGHAMLIASTMGPETWKQIVQAFVRNQVKSFGSDARSLAALYHVFAGNSEECVDELVPPSARAGFQMISTTGNVAGNPLEGLDQWRETLDLVTSNRTPNDAASLISLGKLLAGYGRAEAAHTCYLFAKTAVKHSGPDDPEAHFVLLGANHQATDESFGSDLDSILLTEIYEYAISLSSTSKTGSYIPHLQAFKLIHAQTLAAYGLKTKAQTYCDAITTAYTSTTRPSPYYHPTFTQAVADMSTFLAQTPHDSKAGLFSRPSMNKVSSGASSWFSNSFTKFVSGDDDQDASDSGAAGSDGMGGPFGGVHGDSGSISRNASGTELYNPMMGDIATPGVPQTFAPPSAPSRYTPGAPVASTPSRLAQQYNSSNLPPAEPQRSVSSRYAPPPAGGSNLSIPGSSLSRKASDYSLPYAPNSRRGSAQDTSSQGSYEPRPIFADEGSAYGYSPVIHSPPTHSPAVESPLVLAQQAPAVQEPEDAFAGPNGLAQPLDDEVDVNEETGGGYIPPTGGYEPPEYSYQPYEAEPDSPEEERPKRRQFGDEDEDDAATQKLAAAAKKAQADREADELVRKAAEADAARDKDKAAQKKGWFGGWFGGSRDGTASPGPIKAKLGEENKFYYDENLKKWVNKAAGAEAATSAAPTPPPPKGPASRVASAAMGPPSGPPSRTSSGSGLANLNTNRPPTSGSNAPMSAISSGPPSRSATPASNPPSEASAPPLTNPSLNGSSLGLPLNAARPSSSLSNASSIDDLLGGPPGSRKGGTVKKKKGGRYVDVMAQ